MIPPRRGHQGIRGHRRGPHRLWIKADSVTYVDDPKVEELK
jgi:hypothetical protein